MVSSTSFRSRIETAQALPDELQVCERDLQARRFSKFQQRLAATADADFWDGLLSSSRLEIRMAAAKPRAAAFATRMC